jgi:hypothetical protein
MVGASRLELLTRRWRHASAESMKLRPNPSSAVEVRSATCHFESQRSGAPGDRRRRSEASEPRESMLAGDPTFPTARTAIATHLNAVFVLHDCSAAPFSRLATQALATSRRKSHFLQPRGRRRSR